MPVRVFQGETASLCQQTGYQRVLWLSLDPCLDTVQEHLRCQHERLGLGDYSVQLSFLLQILSPKVSRSLAHAGPLLRVR